MSDTWYHGTRRGFGVGGRLVPRNWHGGEKTSAPINGGVSAEVAESAERESGDWCYITTDASLAWAYAWHAPGRGKPKVLTVQPHGRIERDPEHSVNTPAWRCEWAPVLRVDTTPAVTEQEARDGWGG